jgi:hypothetical protein
LPVQHISGSKGLNKKAKPKFRQFTAVSKPAFRKASFCAFYFRPDALTAGKNQPETLPVVYG